MEQLLVLSQPRSSVIRSSQVSVGGLIFGSTIKPTRFDKPGDKPAAGFIEMINWHAIGGTLGSEQVKFRMIFLLETKTNHPLLEIL